MKKQFRTFFVLLFAVLCTVCLAFGLTACQTHEHSYADTWTSDDTYHWHAPTCDDTDEVKDKAEHVDNNEDEKCDVCAVHVEHKHRYAEEWTSDETGHWHVAICSHTSEKTEIEEHVDADENGECDVCKYELGHEHTFSEEEWESDETGHWHPATCAHTQAKGDFAVHGFDDVGTCLTCNYHKHVFSENYSVDEDYHWYAVLCGHEDAEEKEDHDFTGGTTCPDCGVSFDHFEIYEDYVEVYAEILGEEAPSFTEWYASLIEKGVVEVEINADKDVVYYYEDETSEIAYFGERTIKVQLQITGRTAEEEFPQIWFKVSAIINGETFEVNTDETALGLGQVARGSGSASISFVPYFGYTSTEEDAMVQYIVSIATQAEVGNGFVALPIKYLMATSEAEFIFVSPDAEDGDGDDDIIPSEPVEYDVLFVLEHAISVGEEGKVESFVSGTIKLNQVPAGLYLLTYTGYDADGVQQTTATRQSLEVKIGTGATNTEMLISYNGTKYAAAIYIPEGTDSLTITKAKSQPNMGVSATLLLEALDDLSADGTVQFVPVSFYHSYNSATKNVAQIPLDLTLEPGDYSYSTILYGYNGSSNYGMLGSAVVTTSTGVKRTYNVTSSPASTSASNYAYGKFTVQEGDKSIAFVGSAQYIDYIKNFTAAIVINKIEGTEELEKGFDVEFSQVNRVVYKSFTAKEAGSYSLRVTSETSVRYIQVGKGGGTTFNNVMTAASTAVTSNTVTLDLGANETIIFGIQYNSTSNYPKATFKISKAPDSSAIKVNESASLTFSQSSNLAIRTFTAESEGTYTLMLAGENVQNFKVLKNGTSLIAVGTTETTGVSAVFTAKASEEITIAIFYESSEGAPTVNLKVVYETATKVELNTKYTINFTADLKTAYRSFTPTAEGIYTLVLTGENLGSVKVLNGTTGASLVASIAADTKVYTYTINITSTKDDYVLLFIYDGNGTPAVNYEIDFQSAKTATKVELNTKDTVNFTADLKAAYRTFAPKEAGAYVLVLTGENLGSVKVLNGTTGTNMIASIAADTKITTYTWSIAASAVDAGFVLLFIYDGNGTPAVNYEIDYQTGTELKTTDQEVKFEAGKQVNTVMVTSKSATTYLFTITTQAEDGFANLKLYNGTSGSAISLTRVDDNTRTYTFSTTDSALSMKIIMVWNSTDTYVSYNVKAQPKIGSISITTSSATSHFYIYFKNVAHATKYEIYMGIGTSSTLAAADRKLVDTIDASIVSVGSNIYYTFPATKAYFSFVVKGIDDTGSCMPTESSASSVNLSSATYGDIQAIKYTLDIPQSLVDALDGGYLTMGIGNTASIYYSEVYIYGIKAGKMEVTMYVRDTYRNNNSYNNLHLKGLPSGFVSDKPAKIALEGGTITISELPKYNVTLVVPENYDGNDTVTIYLFNKTSAAAILTTTASISKAEDGKLVVVLHTDAKGPFVVRVVGYGNDYTSTDVDMDGETTTTCTVNITKHPEFEITVKIPKGYLDGDSVTVGLYDEAGKLVNSGKATVDEETVANGGSVVVKVYAPDTKTYTAKVISLKDTVATEFEGLTKGNTKGEIEITNQPEYTITVVIPEGWNGPTSITVGLYEEGSTSAVKSKSVAVSGAGNVVVKLYADDSVAYTAKISTTINNTSYHYIAEPITIEAKKYEGTITVVALTKYTISIVVPANYSGGNSVTVGLFLEGSETAEATTSVSLTSYATAGGTAKAELWVLSGKKYTAKITTTLSNGFGVEPVEIAADKTEATITITTPPVYIITVEIPKGFNTTSMNVTVALYNSENTQVASQQLSVATDIVTAGGKVVATLYTTAEGSLTAKVTTTKTGFTATTVENLTKENNTGTIKFVEQPKFTITVVVPAGYAGTTAYVGIFDSEGNSAGTGSVSLSTVNKDGGSVETSIYVTAEESKTYYAALRLTSISATSANYKGYVGTIAEVSIANPKATITISKATAEYELTVKIPAGYTSSSVRVALLSGNIEVSYASVSVSNVKTDGGEVSTTLYGDKTKDYTVQITNIADNYTYNELKFTAGGETKGALDITAVAAAASIPVSLEPKYYYAY